MILNFKNSQIVHSYIFWTPIMVCATIPYGIRLLRTSLYHSNNPDGAIEHRNLSQNSELDTKLYHVLALCPWPITSSRWATVLISKIGTNTTYLTRMTVSFKEKVQVWVPVPMPGAQKAR